MRSNAPVRNAVVLVLGSVVVACGGSTGPEGPPGPPADRSKLYCRVQAADLNASTSNLSVTARCDAKTDIPWQGACEVSELPTGLYLAQNEPVDWENLDAAPGWTCTWAAYGVAPNINFGGDARICCFPAGASQ